MTTIDCPWCTGPLMTDEALLVVACDDCGVTLDVAPDPVVLRLDAAA
jgi:hypothetical protein